jgi:hypothetical protein
VKDNLLGSIRQRTMGDLTISNLPFFCLIILWCDLYLYKKDTMRDFDDFDGFGDFDEFDEFRRFDREKINRLFRQRMEDDEFRKRFFGIVFWTFI